MLCQTCSIKCLPLKNTCKVALNFVSKLMFYIPKCLFIVSSRYNQRSYSFSQAVSINPTHLRSRSYRVCFYEPNKYLPVLHCLCRWVSLSVRELWGMPPLVSFPDREDKTLSARITGYLHFLCHTHTHTRQHAHFHLCCQSNSEPPGRQRVAIKYLSHVFGPSDGQIQMFIFMIVTNTGGA